MDVFDEILKQASSNKDCASKQINTIDRNDEKSKQTRQKRDVHERTVAKQAVKPKPVPPPVVKAKFSIPKLEKKDEMKERVAAFMERKKQEEHKQVVEKIKQKERLIQMRLENSFGGKANKKLAKQFGTTAIELQQRYGHDRDHEEYLRRLECREEEELDRQVTEMRGGVMRAVQRKQAVDQLIEPTTKTPHRVATNKSNSLRHFMKEDSPGPGPSSSKTVSSKKKSVPMTKKKAAPPTSSIDFSLLMKKAEAIQRGETPPRSPSPAPVRPPVKKNPFYAPLNMQPPVSATSPVSTTSSARRVDTINKYSVGVIKRGTSNTTSEVSRKHKMAEPSKGVDTPKRVSELSKGVDTTKSSTSKRMAESSKGVVTAKRVAEPSKGGDTPKRVTELSKGVDSTRIGSSSTKSNPSKRYLPGDVRYEGPPAPRRAVSANNNTQAQTKRAANSKVPTTPHPGPSRDMKAPTVSYQSPSRDSASLRAKERAILEQRRRRQMAQSERKHTRGGDEPMDDEEYDSDLEDFIDDSEMDEHLKRGDLEETLRLINPRYDKSRWKRNEHAVDDRCMETSFRELSREEQRSSRLGLLEDIREAKSGNSYAL